MDRFNTIPGIAASSRRLSPVVLMIAAVVGGTSATQGQARNWVEHNVGVWVAQRAGGFALQRYNPAGGVIGNMGSGVLYEVGAAPGANAAERAARQNAAVAGFAPWNALGNANVRINFQPRPGGMNPPAPQVTLGWAAETAPGVTRLNGAAATAAVTFENTRTLRTDGWSLDFGGTRPNGMIDEYDILTTSTHELGHVVGLNHPAAVDQVMTAQNTARRDALSAWRANEFGPGTANGAIPAAVRTLGGAAPAATTLGYDRPRRALGAGDTAGATTLYSAPKGGVGGRAAPAGGGGGGGPARDFEYSYSMVNISEGASEYRAREARIPVPSDVNVSDLVAPPGWEIARTPTDVRVWYTGVGGALPGEIVDFSFIADQPPTMSQPTMRWMVDGLDPDGLADPDGTGEDLMNAPPVFNPRDFGILDQGTYTYLFDEGADMWRTIPMDMVVSPVPTPGSMALVMAGGLLACRRRRSA